MSKFDKILLFAVLAIIIIGLFALYSASIRYYSQKIILRQVMWMLVGLAFMAASLRLDYQKVLNASYALYAVNILLLIFVLFFGRSRGGASRWIGIGPISIQPSEVAKITLILALSSYIGSRKNEVTKISFLLRVLCFALPVFLLILVEPDLGTALLIVPITLIMLYVAGARAGHLFGIVLLGVGALPVFWQFLKEYQKQRLFVFINPNIDPLGSGYTIIQSKIAVGSGGIFGKGWLGGTQNQFNFLPERHTDFIFSVIGEEWGFIGALVLISLYALIVVRGLKIIDRTPDLSGKLMATGFIALFAIQAIVNIGMTIGLLPIVGLTLPLISYGGSSMVATLVTMGLLLNIDMRRSLF